MYKIDQRKSKVMDMLLASDTVSVAEIAQRLEISLPTARRLCVLLAEENRAERTRGGLRRLPPGESTYSFDTLRNDHAEEKIAIAKYASSLVKSNQVVFLEAGTTLQHFAIALGERIRNQEITNIVIFTNSLINLEILHPVQSNLQMIGGQYRSDRKDFVGYLSELALKGLRFDYCFVGADAISLSDGVMAMDMDTVRFDAQLVTHAEKSVILAHSEKFRKHALISYVSASEVDCIITDNARDASIAEAYRGRGVNLVTV